MSENVTLSKEELESLQSFSVRYDGITRQYGQVQFQRMLIEDQLKEVDKLMDSLETEMKNVEADRQSTMRSLNEKYGDGSIDLQSGTFVPNKTEQVEGSV
jgi:hypothetical protein